MADVSELSETTDFDLAILDALYGDGAITEAAADQSNQGKQKKKKKKKKAPPMPDPTERNPSMIFSVGSMHEGSESESENLNGLIFRIREDESDAGDDASESTFLRQQAHRRSRRNSFNRQSDISLLRKSGASISHHHDGSESRSSCRSSFYGRGSTSQRSSSRPRNSNRFSVAVREKKAISFCNTPPDMKYIETLDEWDDETIAAVWMTDEEVRGSKQEVEQVAAAFDAGVNDVDIRGLEGKTEEGAWDSYKARKDAINAVLDEFDRQVCDQRAESLDVDQLRRVYIEVSVPHAEKAAQVAREDALLAQSLLEETKRIFLDWKSQRQ